VVDIPYSQLYSMQKKEYPPIIENGFQTITISELEDKFLNPFGDNTHRRKLIERFKVYLNEFMAIGINAEVWVDGSFTTTKPDPDDIDIVFLFRKTDIDYLSGKKALLFESLFMDRDTIKTRYGIDVYFIDKDNASEIEQWIETYGFDTRKLNSKGIFKIILEQNV
jgi:hypothetical protein